MNRRSPPSFDFLLCTDEKVFVYDSETHVDTACHTEQCVNEAVYVRKNLESEHPTLYATGATVGRVFCVMNTLWQIPQPRSLQQLSIYSSTAFYVAPNIVCTSRHIVDIWGYDPVCTYFTPMWRFSTSDVEDLLYTLRFPLDLNASDLATFHHEMAERGLFLADNIFPLTPEHARKFPQYYTKPDLIPTASGTPTNTWNPPNDFAFLHVVRPSEKWLVPSASCPSHGITCLIGYASEPEGQREVRLNGADYLRVVSLERIFGGFNVRFFAPGKMFVPQTIADDGDLRIISHKCSCEATSSGGPIICLQSNADYSSPTFIATQIGGHPNMSFSIATPSTSRTFCMEWATHVLEDIQNANLQSGDPRKPQLIAYLKLVREKWPPGYEHTVISRVNTMLAQLDQNMEI
eukprot:Phypoly_transcript_08043.p1 GENE.Phypoly_transcript_08043~~Phypoly_transcript_08043.p1  ORF type:complete len:405 (+),score=41.39 Phypoly_transcript_08043:308-1522(+)